MANERKEDKTGSKQGQGQNAPGRQGGGQESGRQGQQGGQQGGQGGQGGQGQRGSKQRDK